MRSWWGGLNLGGCVSGDGLQGKAFLFQPHVVEIGVANRHDFNHVVSCGKMDGGGHVVGRKVLPRVIIHADADDLRGTKGIAIIEEIHGQRGGSLNLKAKHTAQVGRVEGVNPVTGFEFPAAEKSSVSRKQGGR
jgi:hypothetical protein